MKSPKDTHHILWGAFALVVSFGLMYAFVIMPAGKKLSPTPVSSPEVSSSSVPGIPHITKEQFCEALVREGVYAPNLDDDASRMVPLTCAVTVASSTPLSFAFVGSDVNEEGRPTVFEVRIYDMAEREIQVIPIGNNIGAMGLRPADFFLGNDYDFDGNRDAMVSTGLSAKANFFDMRMWNPRTGKFEEDPVLRNLPNARFDPEAKTISTHISGGMAGAIYSNATYSFRNGSYVLTVLEEQNLADLTGESSNLMYKRQELRDGAMVTVEEKKIPFTW